MTRVGTAVTAEVALAVVAAGFATQSVAGYVVAGIGGVGGIAALVRRRGRGPADVARDRLRDPAEPPGGGDPGLGAAAHLLPRLHVSEVAVRGAGPLGVAGDGQAFVAVLTAEVTTPGPWPVAELLRVLDDPARPAAVQLLVEQRGAGRAVADPGFAPALTYRSLPVGGVPLWNRVLVAIRHEPAWAPETVAVRGGGATGARAALAAITRRTVVAARHAGLSLLPVAPVELAGLLRDIGDPGSGGEVRTDVWLTSTAFHTALSVPLTGDEALGALLRATAELDVDRCVLSVAASAVDHTVCAVLRLVAADPALLEQAAQRLVDAGLAAALPGQQEAGMVATLPLGGGARSLADLVGQVRP